MSSVLIIHGAGRLSSIVEGFLLGQYQQIYRYIEIDKPLDSCGSYKLDALGISLFESIDCEDYTAIIGIPLIWTADILTQIGVSVP